MSEENNNKKKLYWNQYRKRISQEGKQKTKEDLKQYWKNEANNMVKNVKENDELKSAEVDVVTKFINNEMESSTDDINF